MAEGGRTVAPGMRTTIAAVVMLGVLSSCSAHLAGAVVETPVEVVAYAYSPDEVFYEGDTYYYVTNEYFEGDTYVFIGGQRCVGRGVHDPRNRGTPHAWSPGPRGR